jgi:formaldehyde-activating enzyme involved in methanogenesis
MVTVNADALMGAPRIVMTTAVAEVELQVAVKPTTLLAPKATVGMTDGIKKFEGYVRVIALPGRI